MRRATGDFDEEHLRNCDGGNGRAAARERRTRAGDAELGASLRPATPIVPSVVRSLKQSAVGVTLRVAKRHFHKAIAQLRSAWHPS